MSQALIQISRISGIHKDSIGITIHENEGSPFHIRAEISLEDFANAITTGMKVTAKIIRNESPKV